MKKFGNLLFWLAALGICGLMTWLTLDSGKDFLIYNVSVLCVMLLIIVITWAGGLARMNRVRRDLNQATETLEDVRGGRLPLKTVVGPNASLFDTEYLDEKYHEYLRFLYKSNAAVDIADYIGEYEINNYTWRRTVEMVPDILTSLGILGTFMGLVWGLKGFNPVSYEAMAGSITSLIDGIKVAFVTSIYGLSLSVAYSSSVKNDAGALSEALDRFTDMYYLVAVPPTDTAAANRIAASTKENTEAIREMSDEIALKITDSVKDALLPATGELQSAVGQLADVYSGRQEELMREIAVAVSESMREEFFHEFEDMRGLLRESNKAQEAFIDLVSQSGKQMAGDVREYSRAVQAAAADTEKIHERNAGMISDQQGAMQEYTDSMTKAVRAMQSSAESSAKLLEQMSRRIDTMEKLTKESEENASVAKNYAKEAHRAYNRSTMTAADEMDEIAMLTDRLDHMIILMERSQKQQQKAKDSRFGLFGKKKTETDEERRARRERRWETREEEAVSPSDDDIPEELLDLDIDLDALNKDGKSGFASDADDF